MARSDINDDEAFSSLGSASQRMNVELRDLARQLIDPDDDLQAPSA